MQHACCQAGVALDSAGALGAPGLVGGPRAGQPTQHPDQGQAHDDDRSESHLDRNHGRTPLFASWSA
ncbi:hypothetical protein DLJ58_30215 [Micromonospora arida]|uniref:Uncharacterized protein n=1 Tax=Micromonospora arida TaxID=2203715 RepID=A0A3N9WQM9_9ACTN|nr:hypothetical protein DLJ58_30215 [Micromonospora arida]